MLSYVIPVYKTPQELLRNCLDSVLRYSQLMESICVLDSPGVAYEVVLDEYAAKEPRMWFLKDNRNRSVSYLRNRGLDAAIGMYVAFVDAEVISAKRDLVIDVARRIWMILVAAGHVRARI